ncbi:kelch-like protein 2 isoform X2 [Aphis gossypii]|uniref:kelch-like protein 2 isoform X2 n=1 Tax=Aphis gossypii TaxID=80765 RepID=UPI0021591B34|nr:kelch-like protein 2 isoform X2 [Aphis gossypii]
MSVNELDVLQTSTSTNDSESVIQFNEFNYTNSFHSIQLLEDLKSLRDNEVLCDIKLRTVNGTIVVGHRNILEAASKFFHVKFSNFDKDFKGIVDILIKELDSVLQILVDYIYTGKIKITKENVKVLLPAAKILQLDYVINACVEYLQTGLDTSNCLGIKAFADLHSCMELSSSSGEFIKKNFLQMVKGDEFISLTFEKVIELISCNDIAVPCEEKVFECVIKWIKHDLDSREKFLPQLMEHVRLPLLASKSCLLKHTIDEPLLKNCPKFNDIVSEALHYYLLQSTQYFTIPQTIRCKPRQFGGLKKFSTKWYDPATNLYKNAVEMNDCPMISNICVIRDQFVFAMGNVNGISSSSVSMLDVSSPSPCWVPMADMLIERKYLGVGELNDCIYAIGGNDSDDNTLCSVEVFDVAIQKWRMVTPMNINRSGFGVGVLNDRLYTVGGCDGLNYLKSVECYDPTLDTWTRIANLSICRWGVSVGVLNGVLYAIGGISDDADNFCSDLISDVDTDDSNENSNDDSNENSNDDLNENSNDDKINDDSKSIDSSHHLRSVEVYRPSDGVWSSIADMNLGRYYPGVVALNGLLYVFGGEKDKNSNYCTIEVYDPNTNTWSMKILPKINKNFQIHKGVVVNIPPNFITN